MRERRYWRLATQAARGRHRRDRRARARAARGHRPPAADLRRAALRAALRRARLERDHGAAAAVLGETGERVRSFAVDFVGQAEHFEPDALRPTPDTPYVHDVAEHVGAEHTDIVLDNETLADPAVRRRVVSGARPADRARRHGRLAVPALPGDPRALDGRALRRVRGRALRRLQAVPRPADPAGRRVPVARAERRADDRRRHDPRAGRRRGAGPPGLPAAAYETAVAEVEHLAGRDGLECRMRVRATCT